MVKIEMLALSLAKMNGAFDAGSKAMQLGNPGLLRTYRPEKKADSDHYRIFTTVMGGFKALVADLQAKCSGQHNALTTESTLRDLLKFFGLRTDLSAKPVILFLRNTCGDDSVSLETTLSWFAEMSKETEIGTN